MRTRRFPRTPIIPDVRPPVDPLVAQFGKLSDPPSPIYCTATYSGLWRPGSKYAMAGFQFCALRHGHTGPHLLDAWDGYRFWYDPELHAVSDDGETWDVYDAEEAL